MKTYKKDDILTSDWYHLNIKFFLMNHNDKLIDFNVFSNQVGVIRSLKVPAFNIFGKHLLLIFFKVKI